MISRIVLLAVTVALGACSTGFVRKNGTIVWQEFDEGLGLHYVAIYGVDASTFVKLTDNFGKDRSHIYFQDFQSDADPATFQALGNYYGKDSKHAYFEVIPLTNVDLASFREVKGTSYARDKTKCILRGYEVDCAGAPGP